MGEGELPKLRGSSRALPVAYAELTSVIRVVDSEESMNEHFILLSVSSHSPPLKMSFKPTLQRLAQTGIHSIPSNATAQIAKELLPPLPLYRRLLRVHRKVLPAELRVMGDDYVKVSLISCCPLNWIATTFFADFLRIFILQCRLNSGERDLQIILCIL